MAHSPSGSHVAATSVGNEAFTDAVAEDGGDSKLSALLFAIVRPRLVVADAEFPSSCFLRGIFDAGVRGLSPPLVSVAWFQCVLRIATNLVHIHPILLDVSQQVQDGLQSMLKTSSEIARCDGEIDAELERARDAVAENARALHDERERVQKAALAALDILSGGRCVI
ncbi:uncharacterized protein [Zea mays]|uniref:Uncharacterized protein n=1 Tax=Zea mays TaxID=4577 RepID=A0A804PZU2_MAIZE|nr:uncharacterized protein LOC100278188 isoform X1 [Zea mays]|eukprot:XP_023156022.1 uncharacterized protein LOC100278188 isoform X1 [Zea mays]